MKAGVVMGVMLTQSGDAAFGDRGEVGMRATLEAGGDGAFVAQTLGAARDRVHVRVAVRGKEASGGAVWIAGGLDGDQIGRWHLDHDTDAKLVRLVVVGEHVLEAGVGERDWHVVEVKVDASAGEAALWVDGLLRDELSADLSSAVTAYAWLGAVFKDTALTGVIDLDEWAIGESYIGPVVVAPTSEHANDPSRWLVVYNASVAGPVAGAWDWAEAYRAARGVPYANLLGLELPTAEVIDAAQYAALAEAVNDYLAQTGLGNQVMGVLLGHGVPGYVDFHGWGDAFLDPVPALMHVPATDSLPASNHLAADAVPARPTFGDMFGWRMTARMDGATVAASTALIERADGVMAAGLGEAGAGEARLWFDPFVSGGPVVQWNVAQMLDWWQSIDRQRTRLAGELSGEVDEPEELASFDAIAGDGWYWGWGQASVPTAFFDEPAGRRVCCVELTLAGEARTLRSGGEANWIEAALEAGYASAAASSRAYSASAVPYPRAFFEALRRGWTLGEAWMVAVPMLREGLYLVGDPLMRVAFERGGWDVYGPLHRVTDLREDQPAAMVRSAARSLVLDEALRPGAGEAGHYVLRRVDEAGRREAGVQGVRVINDQGAARQLAWMPAWPGHRDWPVRVEGGDAVVRAVWEREVSACGVSAVVLEGQIDGAPEVVTIAELTSQPRQRVVEVRVGLPAVSARYRWRVVSGDGVAEVTAWSAVVRPRAKREVGLEVV